MAGDGWMRTEMEMEMEMGTDATADDEFFAVGRLSPDDRDKRYGR